MAEITTHIKNEISVLPKTAGVYLFYEGKEIIYIGKAINIKDRVKNHFQQPSYRDDLFIDKVDKIECIETGSEIEALVLESALIKKQLPKFNVVWKDGKNYFFVAIDKNKLGLPYVYITHQKKENAKYIGPFVEGNALKKTLKFLRRVFPFYTAATHPKTKCTWCHLGLCPGSDLFENPPSPKALAGLREYKSNIKKLTLILQGKRKNVLNLLKKEMSVLAKDKKFEEAGKIRDKLQALEQVMAHKQVIGNSEMKVSEEGWEKTQAILQEIIDVKKTISRVECYDISNIQGKQAVGSMVVFADGNPDKNEYRKFKIRMENEPNDIAMLKEVFERRFKNPQWKLPEVMLIDGGIAQLNAAIAIKNMFAKDVVVISIAKGRQELFIEGKKQPIPLKELPQEIYNLVKHLDDEAHRFALTFHRKLRKKAMGLDDKV